MAIGVGCGGGDARGASWLAAIAGAALLLVASGRPALAQEVSSRALAKSDIVRLLVAGTRTQDEIAGTIARSCLTFTPSPKDMLDFRRLGASGQVVSAIEACVRRGERPQKEPARAAVRAKPSNPHLEPLTSDVRPSAVQIPVGSTVSITASLRRGGLPAAGVSVSLGGDLPPGSGTLEATTDAHGQAVFRVPAGRVPGQHVLTLTSPAGSLAGTDSVRIVTTPGAPARAEVDPGRLILLGQSGGYRRLDVLVRDSLDNPLPGERVDLWAGETSGSVVGNRATTDRRGRAAFEISDRDLSGAAMVQVVAGGRPIARVPVVRLDSSQVHVSMRSVTPPGSDSPDSLVLRLTGPAGVPLPDVPVRFHADPGPADPPEARTDAEGRVAVELPEQAPGSESTVTALAGAVRRSLRIGGGEAVGDAYGTIRALGAETRNGTADWTTWLDLGRAYREAGQPVRARSAFRHALSEAPSADEARRRIDAAGGMPPIAGASLGGEARYAGGSGSDLADARADAWPAAGVHVWARYDHSLVPGLPILVRGPDPMRSYLAGASISYGSLGRYQTSLEVGRRDEPLGFDQNYLRLQQSVGFSLARRPAALRVGALVGRWYDRDDWAVSTSLELPLGHDLQLRPTIYIGRLDGTDFRRAGHRAARDRRGYLGVLYVPAPRWSVEVALGEGSVDGELPSLSGHIFDSYVRITIPVASMVRLRVLGRRQAPPDAAAFTALDAGLAVGVM